MAQEEKVDGLPKTDVINGNRYMFLLRGDYFNDVDDDLRGNLHLVKESEFKNNLRVTYSQKNAYSLKASNHQLT